MNKKYSLSFEYWQSFLGRDLAEDEHRMICHVFSEKELNDKIFQLSENIKMHNLYIPTLTDHDGNCLFASLHYCGLGKNINELKLGIANILLFFKNKNDFIPDLGLSLEDLFKMDDNINYVFCKKKRKLYKYAYETMCVDLMTDDGWRRLPTNLILSALSVALNVKFKIYHNAGNVNEICCKEYNNTKVIYLVLIDEFHYLPLDQINEGKNYECPLYISAFNNFKAWADEQYALVNTHIDSDDESVSSEDRGN
jgi:hypothetical protein